MILRYYRMQAAPGRRGELQAAMVHLAAQVKPLSGCEGVELLTDAKDPDALFFIEHWASIADHKAAEAALGKAAFDPVMAVLSGPPKGRYLEAVPLD